ncbi:MULTISPECIES: type II toxin-antitoxin system ParD family antitoxin [Rhodopseudomonas]|uniref:CopG family transcriptional regulator n=1 Tax=Rhodopseudomonas palustris TaxID=1076 RepID=A0A0D7EZZ8_RHOPL|nr:MULTISPECIES: type II toxin-antitoxin system ParD family antitoxin [Rhodopseudomonas]KIZ46419.1 CopG family transcriptional regulator [Rhodopseudomonas palustris]MDF3810169.1 type II toxin-antitoxin system ParD family antitoxin [Rhodopseudomonas sp. BAL398]WOK19781.1 type II toxin-antitoxin system ParD family antitoxin [Rhodopseudomonas sp. BAL398]
MRTSKPITVTLGKQQTSVDRRLASGEYESASEVMRAALRALDREEALVNAAMHDKIAASLSDPRADLAAEDVFARLRDHHQQQVTTKPTDD